MKLGSAPCAALIPMTWMFGMVSLTTVVNAVTWRLVQDLTILLRRCLIGIGATLTLLLSLWVLFLTCATLAISVLRWPALRLCRRLTLSTWAGVLVNVSTVVSDGVTLFVVARLKLLRLRIRLLLSIL